MFKKIILIFLLSLNLFWLSLFPCWGAPDVIPQHFSHRAIFSWALDPTITSQASYLNLLVDGELKFAHIANQAHENEKFVLNLDFTSQQYQLVFDDYFTKGDHDWQIIGFDEQDNILFETEREIFEVGSNQFSLLEFSALLGYILINTLDQFLALILSVGTILFFFIFALFFLTDFILTKGFINFFTKKTTKKGYIFDTKTSQNIPFAIVTVKGYDHNQEYIHKTSVSDVYGFYDSIQVPKGKYSLVARRQGFDFPTRKARVQMIDQNSFYKGEEILVTNSWENLAPLIPMDPIMTQAKKQKFSFNLPAQLWQKWRLLITWQPFFEMSLLILSLIGLFLQKDVFFLLISLFYGFLVLKRAGQNFKPINFYGLVVDDKGIELADAVVEVQKNDTQQNHNLMVVTDKKGKFAFSLKPGTYTLKVQKNGYMTENASRTVSADEIFTVGHKPFYKVARLLPVPELQEEFFFTADNQDVDAPETQSAPLLE